MKFIPNRSAEREFKRSSEMRAFMRSVADDGQREVDRRIPYPSVLDGVEAKGEVEMGPDGYEAVISLEGSGWHLWEFGTVNHGARPALRPGAQAVINRRGGKWRSA